MKRNLLFAATLMFTLPITAYADTIGRYAGIAKSIPEATLKADPKSQAWAHSARTILHVAEESIAESISSMQNAAMRLQRPILCMPQGRSINTALIHEILEQNIAQLKPSDETKNLSNVVVASLSTKYPCQAHQAQAATPAGTEALFAPKDIKMVHVDSHNAN